MRPKRRKLFGDDLLSIRDKLKRTASCLRTVAVKELFVAQSSLFDLENYTFRFSFMYYVLKMMQARQGIEQQPQVRDF